MRTYDGHIGYEEVFIREGIGDPDCCALFRSDFAERELPRWLRRHRGPCCPQHLTQVVMDRAWYPANRAARERRGNGDND